MDVPALKSPAFFMCTDYDPGYGILTAFYLYCARGWRRLKDRLANQIFKTLDLLSDKIAILVRELTPKIIEAA
jgi:hypothetical protein